MKFIYESTYWHGTGKIFNCLNRLLHEVLGCAQAIILMSFFFKVKNLRTIGRVTPKNIPYFIIE
jgi:hypothetical protein